MAIYNLKQPIVAVQFTGDNLDEIANVTGLLVDREDLTNEPLLLFQRESKYPYCQSFKKGDFILTGMGNQHIFSAEYFTHLFEEKVDVRAT